MMDKLGATIHRLSKPLEPLPTETAPRLDTLPGLRAVLFDIYGTLLTSASGDIDASEDRDRGRALEAAIATVGIRVPFSGNDAVADLQRVVLRDHEKARTAGIEFPEVDIREIWRDLLEAWSRLGYLDVEPSSIDIEQLALEYEMRVNPVWPMPDALACLRHLRQNGVLLGLVSNAQFYSSAVLANLFGCSLTDQGFDPDLRFFSYQYRQAKPGTFLYDRAAEALRERGLAPSEAMYVGNDMRNDVLPARHVGFRTALFAGDARSLRLRETDDRARGVDPDLVVTNLLDLIGCLVFD
ncbi:MAG: HAD family hydrolase [Pirellulaceae bacterium]